MNNQDILFERIINAYEEDNLTFFIGAGVSKTVKDNEAKLWKDLVKEMQDILGGEEKDPLILAQILYECFPEKYENITKGAIDDRNISKVHEYIAKLKPKIIITTNWDCLLDKALECSFYDVVASDEELLDSRGERKLIKMHGDFKHRNIVFKEDDYLNYSNNFPLIENYVKTILYTSNVIFLGYSYNDVNLKNIMNWLQQKSGNKNKPFYIITDFEENKLREIYYNKWNMSTYICNNQTMDETNIFADDDLHRSYRIYNFLKSIKDYNNKFNEDILLKKVQLYKRLPFVPLEIMKNVLNCPALMMYDKKLCLMYFRFMESPERKIFDKIRNYLQNDNEDDKIQEIINFINKSKIEGILFLISEQNPQVLVDRINFQVSHEIDINKYLTFSGPAIDEENIEHDYKRRIKELIDREDYLNLIIYIFKISQYHKAICKVLENPNEVIEFRSSVNDVIPKYILNKYKILIDFIQFECIKKYTSDLIKMSEDLLNKRMCEISTNDVDIKILRNKELEDFISFVLCNHLFVEQDIEVKDYVYQLIRYEIIYQYNEITKNRRHLNNEISNMFNMHMPSREIFNIDNKTIVGINLSRLQLFAIIQYLEPYMVDRLLDENSYNSDNVIMLEIDKEDKVWLIEDVLGGILNKCKKEYSDNFFLVKLSWVLRLAILLNIFSRLGIDLNHNDFFKIKQTLMTYKQIFMHSEVLKNLSIFINKWNKHGELDEIVEYIKNNMDGNH